jgi:hypothetical protein
MNDDVIEKEYGPGSDAAIVTRKSKNKIKL